MRIRNPISNEDQKRLAGSQARGATAAVPGARKVALRSSVRSVPSTSFVRGSATPGPMRSLRHGGRQADRFAEPIANVIGSLFRPSRRVRCDRAPGDCL